MTMEPFETLTLAEITAATAKATADKIDPMWKQRIEGLPVGGGFKLTRTESETQRALKTRINRAAEASYRELAWYPQSGLLADGKPGSYVVKVKALDLKAKAEAEASQNGQSGTSQPQQTTEGENGATDTSDENAPQTRVRGRS